MHLLLPLLASVLFVCALILIKRAGAAGVGPVTVLFLANLCSAFAFSTLWICGGTAQSPALLWQPAVIAMLFILGLIFTFLAVERGEVSIATPVFGIKVVFVALLLTVFGEEQLPAAVWYAAALATVGIGLIQWTGRGHRRRVLFTILLALSAATSYATFDVLVQRWSPPWGTGRLFTAWSVERRAGVGRGQDLGRRRIGPAAKSVADATGRRLFVDRRSDAGDRIAAVAGQLTSSCDYLLTPQSQRRQEPQRQAG